MTTYLVADLFCGAGGSSTGALRAIRDIDGVPHLLDIRFRMLSNRELARAMGFDDEAEYQFTGNVGQVTRQIGNAVAVNVAAALVRAVLDDDAVAVDGRAA